MPAGHARIAPWMKRGPSPVRQLGQLEAVIMGHLWSVARPVSVREVLEALPQDLAYTTVMTVMENLRRKDLLTRAKDGRAYRYLPRHTRGEHTAALMEEVLATSNDRRGTLLRFVEHIPAEELAELRDLLNAVAPPGEEPR